MQCGVHEGHARLQHMEVSPGDVLTWKALCQPGVSTVFSYMSVTKESLEREGASSPEGPFADPVLDVSPAISRASFLVLTLIS